MFPSGVDRVLAYNPVENCSSKNYTIKLPEWEGFESIGTGWRGRVDGFAGIEARGGVLVLWMGPSEALYYSNAEVSDGGFNDLPWISGDLTVEARLDKQHYGSAGWGFWNYSMVIGESLPVWFIYLRARSPSYPLNGFYVQTGNILTPIKLFGKPPLMLHLGARLIPWLLPVKLTSLNPVIQDLDLGDYHVYRVRLDRGVAEYFIDDKQVAKHPLRPGGTRFRIDLWIDNAVFTPLKNDYARVYRHVTHENRSRGSLMVRRISFTGETS